MLRTPVHVRDATESDVRQLAELWNELPLRLGGGECPPGAVVTEAGLPAGPGAALEPRDSALHTRVVVAELDGRVVGGAYLRVGVASPLQGERAVHITHLQVDPLFARHGVGQSLVETAVTWAEQLGIGTLLAAASVNDRDANRFLARLGLSPVAVLRGASVSALRAKLPHDPSAAARVGTRRGRSVGRVVAARRSQRRGRDSRDTVA